MGETVLYERDGHVATITYNRPEKLNAINGQLRQDLNAAWEAFRADDEAWVAIVTGAGRSFCVGADLHDGAAAAGTWPGSFWEIPPINSFESGLEVWKPTIAAVNGHCLGYGLTLVAAWTSCSRPTTPSSACRRCGSASRPSSAPSDCRSGSACR